jgi:hypothetical protein
MKDWPRSSKRDFYGTEGHKCGCYNMMTEPIPQPLNLPAQLSEAECLARVAELELRAAQSKDPDLRRQYAHVAEIWKLLSRLADKEV